MSPIPSDQQPDDSPSHWQRTVLNVVALLCGVALLIHGGHHGDTVSQTAGGTIIAATVAAIGWQKTKGTKP